uniref:Uncharacterized protein n=1 Tax=Vitis vinifera TaxID=29760 RepID=F6HCG6_VITVI
MVKDCLLWDQLYKECLLGGDLFSVLSALTYGLFTVLLKKFAGEEGDRVDVQKLFGNYLLSSFWSDQFQSGL